jgi:hypothetical protein
MLTIVCAACRRRGRYSVAKVMEQYGDAKLTDLLVTLSPTARKRLRRASRIAARPSTRGFEFVAPAVANAAPPRARRDWVRSNWRAVRRGIALSL